MLEPSANRRPPKEGRPHAGGRARSIIDGSPNGRKHIALVAALLAVSLIALAIPISRTQARAGPPNSPAASGAGGLMLALQSQAEGVTRALASPTEQGLYQGDLRSVPGSALIPRPLVLAAARLAVRGAIGSAGGQTSLTVQREHPVSFTLHENGFASSRISAEMTVGQALAALGIRLRSHDAVSPDSDSELTPGEHVYLRYASSVRLLTGDEEQTLYTQANTVGGMFSEAGINLEPLDQVSPGTDVSVHEGMTVRLTTVRDVVDAEEEIIEFGTVYVYDSDLPKGEKRLVQAGANGAIRREYRSRVVDGREVSREFVGDTVAPSTDQIIAIGTYVPPTPTPRPAPPSAPTDCPRTLTVYATWYTASSAGGSGRTATGTSVYKGIVAVDPTIIPLGTRMYIPGYGYGLAADTGGGIKGYKIDLGYGPYDIYDWRTRWVDICAY